MRGLFFRYINGNHIIWCSLHRLIHKSLVTTAHRAGERWGLWFSGYRSLQVWPCTNSAFARLERGYKWMVHIISFVFMHQSFVTTPSSEECRGLWVCVCSSHSNHHTVGAASWQNHESSPPQSVIILHSNVCLGLSNPYISSALWRQRKSKNTAHYIPILLRGLDEAVDANDRCFIYSLDLWCTSHEHLVFSHPKNILTPNTKYDICDILFNLFPSTFQAHH